MQANLNVDFSRIVAPGDSKPGSRLTEILDCPK